MSIPISRSSGSNSGVSESDKKAEAARRDRLALARSDLKQDEQLEFASHERAKTIDRKKVERAMQEAEGFGFDIVRVRMEDGETLSFRMSDLESWGYRASTQGPMERWGNIPQPPANLLMQKGEGAPSPNRQAISAGPNPDPVGFGMAMEAQNNFFYNSVMNGEMNNQLFASRRTIRRMNDAMQRQWMLVQMQIAMGDFIGAVNTMVRMGEAESRTVVSNLVTALGKVMRAGSQITAMMARNLPPAMSGDNPQAIAAKAARDQRYLHKQQMLQQAATNNNQTRQFLMEGVADIGRNPIRQMKEWSVSFREGEWRTLFHLANMRA